MAKSSPKPNKSKAKKSPKMAVVGTAELKDYVQYLASPARIFWTNMLAGTARGLGFVLGTVVVLAIVAYVVGNYLTQIPWLGELFRWLDTWLQQNLVSYSS